MIVGVPKEIKIEEYRVALSPHGAKELILRGHKVLIEKGAGTGSGFSDKEYKDFGAVVCSNAREIWEKSELILKVKEPLESEYLFFKKKQLLFTYLHLAADKKLTEMLVKKDVTSIGYETVQLEDGSLPLLMPMSEIAGKLSIQAGAFCLEKKNGGEGILLSGAFGVKSAKVVVLGAGTAGTNAMRLALRIGAEVSIFDTNFTRLRYIQDMTQGLVATYPSITSQIEKEISDADLVISSVLITGAKAPKLITKKMLKGMKKGAVIVDISIDQGGSAETSRPTTHREPTYIVDGVVHYCVANMPAAVSKTSTVSLTNLTLPYVAELADNGFQKTISLNPAFKRGVNTHQGSIIHKAVAEAFGMKWGGI